MHTDFVAFKAHACYNKNISDQWRTYDLAEIGGLD